MSVFDLAKARAEHVRQAGGSETVARLVHSATLGNSMTTMVAGAVADGWLTRSEGEASLKRATLYIQEFENEERRVQA